ncbi:MAG: hypothetical protein SchgKO_23410 [Schleiferiaceae bacterium]
MKKSTPSLFVKALTLSFFVLLVGGYIAFETDSLPFNPTHSNSLQNSISFSTSPNGGKLTSEKDSVAIRDSIKRFQIMSSSKVRIMTSPKIVDSTLIDTAEEANPDFVIMSSSKSLVIQKNPTKDTIQTENESEEPTTESKPK